MQSCGKKQWLAAMHRQMELHKENGTWVLEKSPSGRKAIPCKWVYTVKMNPDDTVEKYKARLVVKGFSQKLDEDYDQTFSPVAKLASVRAVISIAASEKMKLTQFDVSTAFLYGALEEEIYIRQPEGFADVTDKVCRLKKSLYGLKQAPRCWNNRIVGALMKMNFKTSDADPCVFMKTGRSGMLVLALYIKDMKNEFLEGLKKEFKITVKPAYYFLGLEIESTLDGVVKVRQSAYAKKLLTKFDMSDCKPVSTPIVKEFNYSEKEQEVLVGLALLVIGILYKVNFTRYTDTIPSDYDALQYVPTIAIVVGAVIFLIAFLGCCGTIKSNTCMLSWYGAILIVIFVAQIALGIFALIKIKDRNDLETKIQQQLSVLFGKHKQEQTMEVIDLIQTNFHCCGTTGPSYWTSQVMQIPKSCYDSSDKLYTNGCSNVFPEFISSSVKLIGIVALVVSLVEVCGAVLALCLAGCIRDKRRDGAYY